MKISLTILLLSAFTAHAAITELVFGVPPPNPANSYFVDSVDGNDSNDGLRTNTALATISALMSKAQFGTYTNNLKCGSLWREQLTLTANNTTTKSYGSGVPPILDCADVVAAGQWSKTGGRTFVYQFTFTNALGSTSFIRVWEDSTNACLPLASSLANCDSTAGTYYVADPTTSPQTVYVHATGDGNPASNGKVYEYSQRDYGFDGWTTLRTGTTLTGIWTRRNLDNNGSAQLFGTVDGCVFSDGTKHNVLLEPGSTINNSFITNCYYPIGSSIPLVFFTGTGTGQINTASNCVIRSDITGGVGIYAHNGSSGYYARSRILDCTISNFGTGVSPEGRVLEVVGGSISNCDSAILPSGFGCVVTNVAIDVGSTSTHRGIEFYASTASTNHLSNVRLYGNCAYMLMVPDGIAALVTLDNCIITGGLVANGSGGTNQFVCRTNTFTGTMSFVVISAGQVVDADYNSYGASYGFQIAGVSKTFDQWKTATGQDAHSTKP